MKVSLYELTNDLEEIMELLTEEDLPYEQWKELYDQLMELITNKSENTIKYIRNIESRVAIAKAEEDRLKSYRQTEEKKLKRLKEYMVMCLKQANINKIETGIGRVSLRKAPVSVEIDESLLPKKYQEKQIVYKTDKNAIKKLLLDGENIKGARLVDDKYTLTIK